MIVPVAHAVPDQPVARQPEVVAHVLQVATPELHMVRPTAIPPDPKANAHRARVVTIALLNRMAAVTEVVL